MERFLAKGDSSVLLRRRNLQLRCFTSDCYHQNRWRCC